jgi:hypothetical protein
VAATRVPLVAQGLVLPPSFFFPDQHLSKVNECDKDTKDNNHMFIHSLQREMCQPTLKTIDNHGFNHSFYKYFKNI